jgi:hypothetical protein
MRHRIAAPALPDRCPEDILSLKYFPWEAFSFTLGCLFTLLRDCSAHAAWNRSGCPAFVVECARGKG